MKCCDSSGAGFANRNDTFLAKLVVIRLYFRLIFHDICCEGVRIKKTYEVSVSPISLTGDHYREDLDRMVLWMGERQMGSMRSSDEQLEHFAKAKSRTAPIIGFNYHIIAAIIVMLAHASAIVESRSYIVQSVDDYISKNCFRNEKFRECLELFSPAPSTSRVKRSATSSKFLVVTTN
uniref:Uncharacterized protein n=1 Tax=Ascaris lumbricoides TaxID=6252 RepID=A0A0M3HQY6_ASCLU